MIGDYPWPNRNWPTHYVPTTNPNSYPWSSPYDWGTPYVQPVVNPSVVPLTWPAERIKQPAPPEEIEMGEWKSVGRCPKCNMPIWAKPSANKDEVPVTSRSCGCSFY